MNVRKAEDLLPQLRDYTAAHTTAPDELVTDLIKKTHALFKDQISMQTTRAQATLLSMLTKLAGARQAVEIGTFTGLSSLAIAGALPADGRLLCLDISAEYTAIAREFWQRAGLQDRVELRLGPAADSLAELPAEPYLDLAFIDADKQGYSTYWAEVVPRMRPGGLIIVDNVLWKGQAPNPDTDSTDARLIAAFNDEVIADSRVETVMLIFSDGLTLARKR